MDNNISENQRKDQVLKSFAIVGFVGLIIIIAWLGIQLISVLPSAFSSLASLANSVYNYNPVELTVVSNKSIANTDEVFTISWNVPKEPGTFAFSYTCTEGVAVDVRDQNGDVRNISCENNYNIGSVSSIDVVVQSERNRFSDLQYTVAFIPTTGTEPSATATDRVTIVNASISAILGQEDEDVDYSDVVVVPDEEVVPTYTSTTTPPAPTPTYTEEYVYAIPTSNPNGFTDLGTRFLAVGTLDGNRLIPTGTIDNDAQGAIQFEVKNFGTKTSNTWTYTAKLPNGQTYTSKPQTALRPNERAVLTLGFEMPDTTGTKIFNVEVTVTADSKLTNNSFSAVVLVKD